MIEELNLNEDPSENESSLVNNSNEVKQSISINEKIMANGEDDDSKNITSKQSVNQNSNSNENNKTTSIHEPHQPSNIIKNILSNNETMISTISNDPQLSNNKNKIQYSFSKKTKPFRISNKTWERIGIDYVASVYKTLPKTINSPTQKPKLGVPVTYITLSQLRKLGDHYSTGSKKSNYTASLKLSSKFNSPPSSIRNSSLPSIPTFPSPVFSLPPSISNISLSPVLPSFPSFFSPGRDFNSSSTSTSPSFHSTTACSSSETPNSPDSPIIDLNQVPPSPENNFLEEKI